MALESQEISDLYDRTEAEAANAEPANYLDECLSFVKATVAKATRPTVLLSDDEVLNGDLSQRLEPRLVELIDNVRAVLKAVKDLEEESARLKVVKRRK